MSREVLHALHETSHRRHVTRSISQRTLFMQYSNRYSVSILFFYYLIRDSVDSIIYFRDTLERSIVREMFSFLLEMEYQNSTISNVRQHTFQQVQSGGRD